MQIKNFYTSGNNSDKDLYDKLFFSELGLTEITNNDEVMMQLTENLEKIVAKSEGYSLFTIDIKMKHHILLICKSKTYGASYNFCYIMSDKKAIDTGTAFTVEEEKDVDLYDFIKKQAISKLEELDIVSMMITKTMLGYRINKSIPQNAGDSISKYLSLTTTAPDSLLQLKRHSIVSIKRTKTEINGKFNDLKHTYELPFESGVALELDHIYSNKEENRGHNPYNAKFPNIFGRIDDVITVNNKRIALMTVYDGDACVKKSIVYSRITTSELYYKSDNARVVNLNNISYVDTAINNIDYNYIDKGRFFVILGDGYYFKKNIIFQDPLVKQLTLDDIQNELDIIVDKAVKDNIGIRNCSINIQDESKKTFKLDLWKYGSTGSFNINYKEVLKSLKGMYNEYTYVVKKNKSEGSDVKITDSLTYFHEDGKLQYNDFAIETSLETVKAKLHTAAKEYMLKYYRKEITEEKILAELTDLFYKQIDYFLTTTSVTYDFTVKFNNSVEVLIEVAKGGNNFTYINSNRVNKNEISSILTEISCYTSQTAADKFIDNITKKGLSVFIGVSSGYFYNDKFYKFKTSESSGEYKMSIDGIEVNVKGKKLFNTLFSIAFKNEREGKARISNSDYINNHVFASVSSKFDYIKYKIMIDKSYQIFINKSKEFLDKKVIETTSEHIKYYDANQNKVYDAIKVTGTSGKTYAIAYDLRESFVFMNPTINTAITEPDTDDVYHGGTYICMIDQSKMKATVGYDTVVSKLLSLRHDSVIASTIYNLEDELNK